MNGIGETAEAAVVAATLVDHAVGLHVRDAALADAVTPEPERTGVERHEQLLQQISNFWRET